MTHRSRWLHGPWFCFPRLYGESPGAAQVAHTDAALTFAVELWAPLDAPGPCTSIALEHILCNGIEATAASALAMCDRFESQAALVSSASRDLIRSCPESVRVVLASASTRAFIPRYLDGPQSWLASLMRLGSFSACWAGSL